MKTASEKNSRGHILVVDDEPSMREMISIMLRRDGFEVSIASGFAHAHELILNSSYCFALVLTDLVMPDGSGLDLLSLIKQRQPLAEVILMTAHSTVDVAIDAMKRGAYDFVTKPFQTAELRILIHKALEKSAIVAENARLKARLSTESSIEFLGKSQAMCTIADMIQRIAATRTTVLVTGESGTGKERIARAIHQASERAQNPFLVVNCGALPEHLMESELFGHEKGAFTGASCKHNGLFRDAEGGTVFLDEIGELTLPLQVKLLRVLQERKVRPVGATNETSVDVRVIAATNRDVEKEMQEGRFRQDLYYRLNVIRIEVPPLRTRTEDIPHLIEVLLHRYATEHRKTIHGLESEAMRILLSYSFPGNVRELENILERAVTLCHSSVIGLGDLPSTVVGSAASPNASLLLLPEMGCALDAVLSEAERRLILQALERTNGVRTQAAKLLGITFRSLRYRLTKHGLELGDIFDEAS